MVDFTREIKVAQKTAATTPQLAAPTSSLGGDIINAVGTGFQLYQQQQAKSALVDMKAQETEYENVVSKGAMEMIQKRQELLNNNASPTVMAKFQQDILNRYDPSTAMAVLKQANTISGRNLGSVTSASEKKAQDEAAAVQKKIEDRQAVELTATASAAEYGGSINASEMTEQELHMVNIRGEAAKAKRAVQALEGAAEIQKMTLTEDRQNAQSRLFKDVAGSSFVSQNSSRAASFIQGQGGLTPQSVPGIVDYLTQQKANIRNNFNSEFVRKAREENLYVSQSDIDEIVTSTEQAYDTYIDRLKNEDTLKALQNNMSLVYEGGLLSMVGSTNPDARKAGYGILGSKYVGSTPAMTDFTTLTKFATRTLAAGIDITDPYLGKNLNGVIKTLSPLDPSQASSRYEYTNDVFETLLNGTTKQQKAVAKEGALSTLIKVIADEGNVIVDPAKASEHAENLYRISSKAISAQVAKLTTQQEVRKKQGNLYQQDPLLSYGFDISDGGLKLVGTGGNVQSSSEVRKLNTLISDNLKAFDKLIEDEVARKEMKEMFINDVVTSISISPKK